MGVSQGAQNSEEQKPFLEEERRECPGHANHKVHSQMLPLPLQMKAFNKLWPALAESKLATVLFAGLFVGAVILFSVPPQFPLDGANGEPPLYLIAKLVTVIMRGLPSSSRPCFELSKFSCGARRKTAEQVRRRMRRTAMHSPRWR
jgi:hypothetical protein